VRRALVALVGLVGLAVASGCGGGGGGGGGPLPDVAGKLGITSPAFEDAGTIPARYTCSGAGAAPPLRFSRVPAKARELALVVEDTDADHFLHWTVLGIPPRTRGLAGKAPAGTVETANGFGDHGWGAPCPPEGDDPHRYLFELYALDAPLGLDDNASGGDVRDAIADHALAAGTLIGRFGR
jgi:Raf kinase inhibitor-like YbhB/YbcL family protein